MVGHAIAQHPSRLDLAGIQQFKQQLAVMEDWPLAASRRVLVPQRVKRVRVRAEDPVELTRLQKLNILIRKRRPQPFLAGSPDVAPARLLGVIQDSEIDLGVVENRRQRPCAPLIAGVVRRVVAHEPERLDTFGARVLYVEVQCSRPPRTLPSGLAK